MAEEYKRRIYKVTYLEEKNVHSDQEKWDKINGNPRAMGRQYEDLGRKEEAHGVSYFWDRAELLQFREYPLLQLKW